MSVEDRRELEHLVEGIRALIVKLRRHDQPLATQLLEMAILDIKSRMHGIGDEEFQALVDVLSGEGPPAAESESAEIDDLYGLPAQSSPCGRVVTLGEVRRAKCKRRR